jgi:hypothetical protein
MGRIRDQFVSKRLRVYDIPLLSEIPRGKGIKKERAAANSTWEPRPCFEVLFRILQASPFRAGIDPSVAVKIAAVFLGMVDSGAEQRPALSGSDPSIMVVVEAPLDCGVNAGVGDPASIARAGERERRRSHYGQGGEESHDPL